MKYDAIVVGGGHNGLTAACYLAEAGFKTLVLERRHIVGGAAASEEFHPGYRNSIASYSPGMLRSEVIRDLHLKRLGLSFIPYHGSLDLMSDGRTLLLTGDERHDQAEFGRYSNSDYEATKKFRNILLRVGDVVREQFLTEPLDLGGGIGQLVPALKLGGRLRQLSLDERQFLIQMFTSSAYEIVHRHFESDIVRQSYAVHALAGNFVSLRAPGSAAPMFIDALGEFDGKRHQWGIAVGGMGSITQAMQRRAEELGVDVRLSAPVSRIIVRNRVAEGVELESGEKFQSRVVLANTDPKRTFLKFVGAEHLDENFARDIENIKMGTGALRMNLALRGTPEFARLSGRDAEIGLRSGITVLPTIESVEDAYHMALKGECTADPYLAIQIPSSLDNTLAPPGHHVMSLACKYYPYDLSGGRKWADIKEAVADSIVDIVAFHFPNIKDLIVGRQVLTPFDLEQVLGLTRGDIFHGAHQPHQLFSMRPHPKAAQYRTPIKALYLCGSGSHPGGGVTGGPGHNAAHRVIKDLKRGSAV
ncbi:MAG TPA: NAD(P)/FAD-dependent oxidoreductase [Dongiaceae bacterium]|jgi:phytoene dehydrogenase-like protein|nr:NAD(P)/FAD-dependent oxidoreductase [Dongiaceae bacterium]